MIVFLRNKFLVCNRWTLTTAVNIKYSVPVGVLTRFGYKAKQSKVVKKRVKAEAFIPIK